MSAGGISQQFCVRWNSHLGSLGAAFPQLLAGQRFVDVTLACEGHQVHCHRLVLAACSSYFESLLGENPCKHPIIILPRDVKLWEVQALVDFMYKGEVNVSQAGLPDLLKCAETLQIRGLCGSDAALNLNQITNTTTGRVTAFSTLTGGLSEPSSSLATHSNSIISNKTSSTSGNNGTKTGCLIAAINSNIHTNNNQPNLQNTSSKAVVSPAKSTAGAIVTDTAKNLGISTKNITRSSGGLSNPSTTSDDSRKLNSGTKSRHTLESEDSVVNIDDGDDSPNTSCVDFNVKSEDMDDSDSKHRDEDYIDDMDDDPNAKLQGENDQQEVVTVHLDIDHPVASKSPLNTPISSPKPDQLEPTASYPSLPGLDIDIIEINDNNDSSPITPTKTSSGSIRVKSLENLFENYKHHENRHYTHQHPSKINMKNISSEDQVTKKDDDVPSPASSISIELDSDENQKVNSVNRSINDLNESSKNDMGSFEDFDTHFLIDGDDEDDDFVDEIDESDQTHTNSNRNDRNASLEELMQQDDNYDDDCHLLPPSLKFNKNTMTIYVKNSVKEMRNFEQPKSRRRQTSTPIASNSNNSCQEDEQFESIVCSPNFVPISYMSNEDDDGDNETGNFNEAELNSSHDLLTESMSSMHDSDLIICDDDTESDSPSQDKFQNQKGEYELPQLIPYGYRRDSQEKTNKKLIKIESRTHESVGNSFGFGGNNKSPGMLLMKMSANRMLAAGGAGSSSYGNGVRRGGLARLLQPKQSSIDEQGQFRQLPSSVVLRNPRGNQPRTYNTDALYAALMDVKSGESIYRASQIHKVPRKTLRNWMKRWDIKSAYPMPYQLKQAAEKKKQERRTHSYKDKFKFEKD